MRSMVYVQVNLHTLNLIFLSVLLYPRRSLLSALMLALAVHLKGSPAVLVLAFLLEKDWRWLTWFAISMVAVAGITVLTDGFSPFLDVIQHWQGLALSENTIYHDTSIDSFLRSTAGFISLAPAWTRFLIYSGKAALVAGSLWVMVRCVRAGQFVKARVPAALMLNALPPLFILMTLSAPVVWEHHGVFVALSFLVMLKRLETPHEWLWFGLAYLLEFLLPTFDFYPWSFGRLIAPMLILWQMWWIAERRGDAAMFTTINRWFEKLSVLRSAA